MIPHTVHWSEAANNSSPQGSIHWHFPVLCQVWSSRKVHRKVRTYFFSHFESCIWKWSEWKLFCISSFNSTQALYCTVWELLWYSSLIPVIQKSQHFIVLKPLKESCWSLQGWSAAKSVSPLLRSSHSAKIAEDTGILMLPRDNLRISSFLWNNCSKFIHLNWAGLLPHLKAQNLESWIFRSNWISTGWHRFRTSSMILTANPFHSSLITWGSAVCSKM